MHNVFDQESIDQDYKSLLARNAWGRVGSPVAKANQGGIVTTEELADFLHDRIQERTKEEFMRLLVEYGRNK